VGNTVATIAVDLYHAPYPNGLNALVKGCPGCRRISVMYVYDPGVWTPRGRYGGMSYNVEVSILRDTQFLGMQYRPLNPAIA